MIIDGAPAIQARGGAGKSSVFNVGSGGGGGGGTIILIAETFEYLTSLFQFSTAGGAGGSGGYPGTAGSPGQTFSLLWGPSQGGSSTPPAAGEATPTPITVSGPTALAINNLYRTVGGGYTLSLPNAALSPGARIIVVDSDGSSYGATPVTISSAQKINGRTLPYTLGRWQFVTFRSDGVDWFADG